MKTPNEIKEGLECCKGHPTCSLCPYYNDPTCEVLEGEALTYIQQLESKICGLTEKVSQLEAAYPKWISVEERLPDDKETVLTYKNGIVELQVYEKRKNGWVDRCNWFWSMGTVSHWMLLPMPPKEECNNG